MSQNFADSVTLRLEEIVTSTESLRCCQPRAASHSNRSSKVLTLEGAGAGRVWSFRDVTERHKSEMTADRSAALVASVR